MRILLGCFKDILYDPNWPFYCINTLDIGVFAGYKESSGIPSAVYRTATFPGLGFLLKKSFYEKAIKGNQQSCCTKRSVFAFGVSQQLLSY